MVVFDQISFGQAVEQASRQPMTGGGMTELDAMIFNQLAGDDELLEIVSGRAGTTGDVTGGNSGGVNLRNALLARVDVLEAKGALSESEQYTLDFYRTLADNPRYGDLVISDAVNYSGTGVSDTNGKPYTSYMQMATFHLADGTCVPSYAGTGPEIASWLEDGRMATTETGVDAQKAAADYLNYVMDQNPDAVFYTNGYSKGGNGAVFAAVNAREQERIAGVFNFDGPGFGDALLADPEFAARYQALKNRLGKGLYCLSPQNSIVGHLMNDHDRYVYMATDATVFADHDYMTWHWQTDGSVERVEDRTELSVQTEALMDGLIVQLSDAELDRLYDMLEELAVRHGVFRLSDLPKLGMDENGEFSLPTLVGTLADFWNGCSAEDKKLLIDVMLTALSPENLVRLGAAWLDDWLREQGIDNPLGVEGTAVAIVLGVRILAVPLLKALTVLLALAAVAGAIYGLFRLVESLADWLAGLHLPTLQEVFNGAMGLLDQAAGYVEDFFTRLRNGLRKNKLWQAVSGVVCEGWDALVTGGKKLIGWAADGFGRWIENTVEPLVSKLGKTVLGTAGNLAAIVDTVLRDAKSLAGVALEELRRHLLDWSKGWTGCHTLTFDRQALAEALVLLRAADERTAPLAARLRRLASRLAVEGITDGDGILRTFLNLYHLTVADLVVDLHDDVDGMVCRVQAVADQYDENIDRVRRNLAALPG